MIIFVSLCIYWWLDVMLCQGIYSYREDMARFLSMSYWYPLIGLINVWWRLLDSDNTDGSRMAALVNTQSGSMCDPCTDKYELTQTSGQSFMALTRWYHNLLPSWMYVTFFMYTFLDMRSRCVQCIMKVWLYWYIPGTALQAVGPAVRPLSSFVMCNRHPYKLKQSCVILLK